MMCPKCGMELASKSYKPMTDDMTDDMEVSAKDAVLEDLLKMLEGSAGSKLGKPKAVAIEMVSKEDEDEEEEA